MPIACALVAVASAVLASIAEFNLAGQLLSAVALVAVAARMAVAVHDNQRLLDGTREDADTDALTGLANRRRLLEDLKGVEAQASHDRPWILALFDLNGFKRYNDVYGHPAGDQLLARLGQRLADALGTEGRAYRLGGDEFCVLAEVDGFRSQNLLKRSHAALSELGEGFSVDAAHGAVALPTEAPDATGALQLADTRMYGTQARRPRLGLRADLPGARDRALGGPPGPPAAPGGGGRAGVGGGARAGHVGRGARRGPARGPAPRPRARSPSPTRSCNKPGPLDEDEWAFMRRHTLDRGADPERRPGAGARSGGW